MTRRLATKPMDRLCPQLLPRPGWHGRCHKGHAACMRSARQFEAKARQTAFRARGAAS